MEEIDGVGHDLAGVGSTSPNHSPSDPLTSKRLLITKIFLENFKSYGGTKEIGPFHKRFSSIVGPNGSGKSNVIDAMLFVFGKRAKKLRLNKVSELIHKSEKFPNFDSASVSVHFVDIIDDPNSDDGYSTVPGTELMVSRTAYLNNSSKYQVNGKTSTFTEVGALLRHRGIDLDNNRFLILQGEVEQISLMKPKAEGPHDEGLLEYLEDIIGSNKYVEPTEKALAELEELNEIRTEKLRRLQVAEKEKENLEGAREEAQAYLEKEALIRVKRNILYQLCELEASKSKEEVMERHKDLSSNLEKERRKLEQAEKSLSGIEKSYEDMTADYSVISKELSDTKADFAEYERKDIKMQEDMRFLTGQARKLGTDLKREEKRRDVASSRIDAAEARKPELCDSVKNAESRMAREEVALEKVHESLKGETGKLRVELEGKQAEMAPVRVKVSSLMATMDKEKCELSLITAPIDCAKKDLEMAQDSLKKLLDETKENRRRLYSALKEEKSIDGEINIAKEEGVKATEMEASAVTAMTTKISALEEAKASREAQGNAPRVLKGIMSEVAKGDKGELGRAGVHGRLGDLGCIDESYDIAVSTACPQLDYIVVDTSAGASQCVEYLRAKSLGRASFIILEQLGNLSQAMERGKGKTGGERRECPRLFDQITPVDSRFREAFYLGLHDTLVAPDLDTATAVAYKGGSCVARVVTLQGQLIDRSGTMSGGGSSVKRGGMGAKKKFTTSSSVSDKEFARLNAEADEAKNRVQEIRRRRKDLDEKVKALQKRKKDLSIEVPKLQLALESVEIRESRLNESIKSLGNCKLSSSDEKKASELRKKLCRSEKAVVEVKSQLSVLEEEVMSLQKQILEVGGDRLKNATKAMDRATRAHDEAVAALGVAGVEIQVEMKKFQRAEKDIEEKNKEILEVKAKLVQIETDAGRLEEAALSVLKAFEKATAVAASKKEELESVTVEYEELQAQTTKIRKVEVEILNQLEEYIAVANDNKEKEEYFRKEIVKLKAKHAEEIEEWGFQISENNISDGAVAGAVQITPGMKDEEGAAAFTAAAAVRRQKKKNNTEESDDESDGEGGDTEQAVTTAMEKDDEGYGGDDDWKNSKQSALITPLDDLSPEYLSDLKKDDVAYEIGVLQGESDSLKADVNMGVLAEYKKKEEEYLGRVKSLDDATGARDVARRKHEELRHVRLEAFMAGFGAITLRLKEMYQMITLGGDAELELVDSLDPFSEGVVFSVRPPKKSWKNIANLSGGKMMDCPRTDGGGLRLL